MFTSKRTSSYNFISQLQYRESSSKRVFLNYDKAFYKLRNNKVETISNEFSQNNLQELDTPIFACKFSLLTENIAAVANENGTLCIDNSLTGTKLYMQPHDNTIFDIAWVPNDTKLVTASGDHSALLIDVGNDGCKIANRFLGHMRSVKTIGFKVNDNSVFATGSRDGAVIVWDLRCSARCSTVTPSQFPDQIIPAHLVSEGKKRNLLLLSVTGVAFQDENTIISCGSTESCIKLWDMRWTHCRKDHQSIPKQELFTPKGGFSSLSLNAERTKLYVNCMDQNIYCFNINSTSSDPIGCFYGHENKSYYIKSCLSPDSKYLVSGSSDNFVYIWNTEGIEYSKTARPPLVRLQGHTGEVNGVDFIADGSLKILSSSDDSTYRTWGLDLTERAEQEHTGLAERLENKNLRTPPKLLKRKNKTSKSSPKRKKTNLQSNIRKYFSDSKRSRNDEGDSPKKRLKYEKENKKTKRKLLDVLEEEPEMSAKRIALSPVKNKNKNTECTTPTPLEKTDLLEFKSPTMNLPNFVLDGTTPYNHKCTKIKQDEDWLTKLRREMKRIPSESESPVLPEKRPRRSASTESKEEPTKKTLLTYFKSFSKSRTTKLET